PSKDVVRSATPFFSYYVVETLYQAGRGQAALHELRRWLKMAETPPGTFWEYWEPHFSRSHGWSCAPSILLPQMVLGVRMTETAFNRFEVRPHHWDQLDWARGSVPLSGGGSIEVAWKRGQALFQLQVESPADKLPSIHLPDLFNAYRLEVYQDGEQGLQLVKTPVRRSEGRISLQMPSGGRYLVRLKEDRP
ncbi:MAG TPA: alpha-L-rhamnosidase C-terminal domain-containing protein, partial [Acidobacteriota bacterium]|nr:alpha-L-rhamnosidase C-terminal domain-containing protein [Acidobacteriota bacterium]